MSNQLLKIKQKIKKDSDPFVWGGYIFSIIYAVLIIIPLYFVIISAFKTNNQIILTPRIKMINFKKPCPVLMLHGVSATPTEVS